MHVADWVEQTIWWYTKLMKMWILQAFSPDLKTNGEWNNPASFIYFETKEKGEAAQDRRM